VTRVVANQLSRRQPPASHHARIAEFVEEFAVHLETEGRPRMAGRILAFLLVCEPPERTAAELARELRASTGSISTMTRLLEAAGLIERVSRAGERADRFRVTPERVSAVIHGMGARIRRLRELTERGLDVMAGRPPAACARLNAVHKLYALFEKRIPTLVDEWEREHVTWR